MNEQIIKDISSNKGSILIYVNEEGEIVMITSGKLTEKQMSATTKILTLISDHSYVFSIVLYLEILFTRISFFFKDLFKREE